MNAVGRRDEPRGVEDAIVDGVSWDTSIWRDTKANGTLLAVPARIRGRKRSGDSVTVEFTFDPEEDE